MLDALAEQQGAQWHRSSLMERAEIRLGDHVVTLIKPQTYMNSSGGVIPWCTKQGVTPDQIMVVHDELELPFGKLAFRSGGSARGHNGLKSLIAACGTDAFHRFRFGIGRPAQKEQVPDYVLHNFSEPAAEVERLITEAVTLLVGFCNN